MEQALDFWTSLGRVGSPLVSSGPIVQALENLNTAAAQASDLVDERRIKNHIAGVQELQGIQRTHQGKLMIEGSSAMEVLELEQTAAGAADPYQKEQVEEELKLAQTALKQTTVEYNKQLEQEHKECFQALDDSIREFAHRAIDQSATDTGGTTVKDTTLRGMTL